MAYNLHHTVRFFNCLNENIYIELYKKDVEPDEVTTLLANSFTVQYPTGSSDLFDEPIIACEAKLNITLYTDDNQTFDDLLVTYPDEWKMIAYADDHIVFIGFLTPGEGRSELQDKPYDIVLSAVDGLGLLKGIPLTKDDGSNFTDVNLILDYALAILNKTGLDLNLRLFSNIVEESMEDRIQNEQADTFNQTGLHARTFLKNPTEFYDCYTCLQRILAEYYCIYQWNGKWVILRGGELQENPGVKIWYTEYDTSGAIVEVHQNLENAGAVGRDRLIHPVELSQFIGSNFAVKSSKYTFDYSVWPELPTNNKFERGTFITGGSGNVYEQDQNGDDAIPLVLIGTFQDYFIDDWLFGTFFVGPTAIANLPALGAGIDFPAWRRSSSNQFGVEFNREILIEKTTTETQVLQSSAIPVYAGDKLNITFDFKMSFNYNDELRIAVVNVYVIPNSGGSPYWWRDGAGISNRWRQNGAAFESIFVEYFDGNEKTKVYKSVNLESQSIPVDGVAYVQLLNVMDDGLPNQLYFRNFSLEYIPFIAGGYIQIKGDYAQTSQNANFKDSIDENVFISDSPKKLFQGALYRENLTDLTTPTWHRFNVSEQRHFKELGELARFNNNYRRMWKIDGQFDGLKFNPSSDSPLLEPISFHRHFIFPDVSLLSGRYFVLVPPLTLNYSEGRADMNFIEVLQEDSDDGNSTGDTHIPLQYIFE
jgi:hypothetical protein